MSADPITSAPGTQLRGDRLREHILWSAKEVFLRVGYSDASMDAIAAEARTSKRSLYAHFQTKENLFFAVLDLVRSLYLSRLETPGVYADDPTEAIALFCGRFLQLLLWEPQVRTYRLAVASVERLPESAVAYYEAIFSSSVARLGEFVLDKNLVNAELVSGTVESIVDRVVLPRFLRAGLGVEPPLPEAHPGRLADDIDLDHIRDVVRAALVSP